MAGKWSSNTIAQRNSSFSPRASRILSAGGILLRPYEGQIFGSTPDGEAHGHAR